MPARDPLCVFLCVRTLFIVNFVGVSEASDRLYPRRPGAARDPGIVFDTAHLLPSLMCSPSLLRKRGLSPQMQIQGRRKRTGKVHERGGSL